ncbi:MAG: hypothetical protein BWX90_00207 [bacterium ADurb.Bin132]|nr:MAG: hypothetical protein BWX90_00207 [bacterium ADurb.Bin132]
MELVLHCGIKCFCYLGFWVVVYACCVDIGYFLVEEPLGGADVSDALEQFIKILVAKCAPGLDAFIIKSEPFDQKLGESCGGPLTKCSTARRTDTVANCENGIEVIMLYNA